jgi:hypothetical protein
VRSAALTLGAVAALLLTGTGGAAPAATLPSLYVNYNAGCHFTMALDGGVAVASGSSIPYGLYQVVVSAPIAFSSGLGGCEYVNFQLSGPGVSYTTQLQQGDATNDMSTQTFKAGSSYSAVDNTVPPGSSIQFTTSNTPVANPGGSSSSSSSSSGSSASGGSSSAYGTPVTSSSSGSTKLLGTLVGTVNSAGKLTLSFKGKAVAQLASGKYTVTVTDKSSKAGFVIQTGSHKTTVTSPGFMGKKSVAVTLAKGQCLYFAKAGSPKTYFVATGSG